ncbi:hypothetical protein BD410DRAFT_895054 [Rickenella mellea]|uniref:Uncharacterized protein n=1 Tax=Rickenella mellea TaxID=50990 RepID=A0A4Y7QIV9_9AGAM|nr:hypothetical protein BD410DRAFT_895054 [Rickenella mellea]
MDSTASPTPPASALPSPTSSIPTQTPQTSHLDGESRQTSISTPNTSAHNSPTNGAAPAKDIIVFSIITIIFMMMYKVILEGFHWESFQYVAVLHLVCAPATLKRYPTAETSTLLHFMGYMTCVVEVAVLYVPEIYQKNPILGIMCGLAAVVAFVAAEILFNTLLEKLGCSTGSYGQFRKEHGVLGAQSVAWFFHPIFVVIRQRFLARARRRKKASRVPTVATTAPLSCARNSVAPMIPEMKVTPTAPSDSQV